MIACGNEKHCPSCKQTKRLSAFGKSKHRKDNLTVYCKECKNRKQREKYHSSPELRAQKYAKTKQRYANDAKAHEEQLERQRKWYKEHYADPEFRARENERHRKRWRESERGRILKLASNRRYTKRRYASDPEFKARIDGHNRRYFHQRRANGGSYTQIQWEMLLDLCNNQCVKCGGTAGIEIDHIIPVIMGGTSNIENLQPLCRSCNASKGTTIIDYRADDTASVVYAGFI